MEKVDIINDYKDFVMSRISKESSDLTSFINRIDKLDIDSEVNIPMMITGAMGLGSETGELEEIVKKVLFQGKVLDESVIFHMKREAGDIMFYWALLCIALNLDPNEVIKENKEKLMARYPNGFEVAKSENRAAGDI